MGADLTHITGTKSNLGALVVSERASEHAGRCLPLAVPLSPPSGSLSECPPLTTPALNRPPHTHSQLKPSHPEGQPWRRLRVDNSGTATLRSRKLRWWLLTLDATAHANPLQRTFDVSYRWGVRACVCACVGRVWGLGRGSPKAGP